ncbi:transmembrane, partial [Olea europaea subsp. europaea]
YLKCSIWEWDLSPTLLLAISVVPTLWLSLSPVFVGLNIAITLSSVGQDFIFNLGASIFLLIVDSCSRPKNRTLG